MREGAVGGKAHGIADSYPNSIPPVLQAIDRRPVYLVEELRSRSNEATFCEPPKMV